MAQAAYNLRIVRRSVFPKEFSSPKHNCLQRKAETEEVAAETEAEGEEVAAETADAEAEE